MIKVKNISKIYKLYTNPKDRMKEALSPLRKKYHTDFYALKDVSFDVKKGETVGIIGKNGAGKSTLLKILTGVLTPTSGNYQVKGKIASLLELGAGFNPELSGMENIYFNGSIIGYTKDEMDQKLQAILDFADIGEFIHQPVKTYSSGMYARLAFAVAISIEPEILIIDEVLSVGDFAFQRKCFAKMEEIKKRGTTILFVSHSESSIVSLCERAIWMNKGSILLDGRPKFITGLYLKYGGEKSIDKKEIIKEYHNLCKGENKIKDKDPVIDEGFYELSLKSESVVSYKEKGVKITNVGITTIKGEPVNILQSGKHYIYTYKVTPEKEIKDVQFGLLIKMLNGVELGGGVYPEFTKYIPKIDKTVIVNFQFKCNLNNGEYFLNAGVMAHIGNTRDFAHRMLDAYRFKVINANKQVTGSVDFIRNVELKEL